MLLNHEINNTLYKFIRQELQFPWLLKCATKSGKISSGTKLGLRSNYVDATSSCDLLLIYVMSLNNVKH